MRVASKSEYECLENTSWINDTKQVGSDFVVKSLWLFETEEHFHFIYPFVPGKLPSVQQFSVSQARFYLSELLVALEFLERNGVHYR